MKYKETTKVQMLSYMLVIHKQTDIFKQGGYVF